MWDALADFRTALSYSHDNDQYQLRLVQALMMPGIRKESGLEARTYLLEREQIILLLPRGLITAVLAVQVIEDRGAEFGFLRVVAFATILSTNLLVVLGSVRARRAAPQPAPVQLIPQEPAPE